MSFYEVQVSHTVKIDRRIDYECENCGHFSSYTQTHKELVSERGQSGGKSRARARDLSSKLSLETQGRTLDIIEKWRTEKPGFRDYGFEKCPNCGYVQSWMQETFVDKQRSRFVQWSTAIITIAVIAAFVILDKLTSIIPPQEALGLDLIVVWTILFVIIRLIGKRIPKLFPLNKHFGEVTRKNEPTITWGEPLITSE